MSASKPLPEITSVTKPFWDAAAQHKLRIQRCQSCGRAQHAPVVLCPACGAELDWVDASGRATIYTFTVFRQAYHPGIAQDVPYNVSVVGFEEGPHMLTNVVGCDLDELYIGMPVRVVFDDVGEGVTLPKFAPVAGSEQ